jgi:carbon-monoxide dehydrogenase large subunit
MTAFAQVAVDVFQVPMEKIRIGMGDTDRVTGFGSAGSRSLFVVGSAVKVASERTVETATKLAASELEAADTDIEYASGVFRIGGTDRSIGLFDLAGNRRTGRSSSNPRALSATRRGRTAATSAKWRSIRRPVR